MISPPTFSKLMSRLWELRRQLGLSSRDACVDGDVEAEIVLIHLRFFIGAGDADDAAAVDFSSLADDAAGGSSGGGDDEGFAGLRLAISRGRNRR